MIGWLKRKWSTLIGKSLVGAGVVSIVVGTFLHDQLAELWHWIVGGGLTSQQALDTYAAAWHWLWAPSGVPHIVVGILLALLMLMFYRIVQIPWQHMPPPSQTPPQAPQAPPLRAHDLSKNERLFLIMLWRIYPDPIELRRFEREFDLTYPAIERLAESVEARGLVAITPAYDHSVHSRGALVVLTKRGRDFCHDNGLAGDQSASAAPASPPRLAPPPPAPFSELEDTLLTVLASEYPDSVELRDLPARLKQTSLAAEQVADDLEGRGFVKVNRVVGYGSNSSGSVALTPAGRSLCLEKGLDLLG